MIETIIICFLLTAVLFLICKWIRESCWPKLLKIVIGGLILNTIVLAAIFASFPFAMEDCEDIFLKSEAGNGD